MDVRLSGSRPTRERGRSGFRAVMLTYGHMLYVASDLSLCLPTLYCVCHLIW